MFVNFSKAFFPDGRILGYVKKCGSCVEIFVGVLVVVICVFGIVMALQQQEFTFFINWSMMFSFNISFAFAVCVNIVQFLSGLNFLSDGVESAINSVRFVYKFVYGLWKFGRKAAGNS